MPVKMKAVRWKWADWLARLESSALTEAQKETGRRFRHACGRKRSWTAAYEVEGAWERDNTVLRDLHAIARQNLLAHSSGHFRPVLGPSPPAPKSIRLTGDELRLLGWMLRHGGNRGLYRINRHGYIDRHDDTANWQLRIEFGEGAAPPWRNPPDALVEGLGEKGLLEHNGCGHGWPFQWTSEFRVATHRLHAVANLPKDLERYATE